MEHIGKAAYKLKLLDGARVHPAFHYSLLKPFHHSTLDTTSPLPLPATSIKNQSIITPLVCIEYSLGPCFCLSQAASVSPMGGLIT